MTEKKVENSSSKVGVGTVIIIIAVVAVFALVYFKQFRVAKVSDVVEGGRYHFRMNFGKFGFAGVEADNGLPYIATVMIFGDGSGAAMIGEIDGNLWTDIGYLGFLENEQLLEQLLGRTWIFDAEVVRVNVPDVYENIVPIIEGGLVVDFSDTSTWRQAEIDVMLKVHSYHPAQWWE